MTYSFSRRLLLCACCGLFGWILFRASFSNSFMISIALAIYFIILSPTERIAEESLPIVSLVIYFIAHQTVQIQSGIITVVSFMMIYWTMLFVLTIISPRAQMNDTNKPPPEAIIDESKNVKCGLTYWLEKESPSEELFIELRQTADDLADDLWPDLLQLITKKKIKSKSDINPLEILLENVDTNPKFKKFVDAASKVPDWCDWKQLNRAQNLHQRLSIGFAYVLGLCTLVGGFGCPEINKVLISSRYWANNNDQRSLTNTLNRLRETSVWLYSVMRDTNALKPFNVGWKSILRVRLFHAQVRYQLAIKHRAANGVQDANQSTKSVHDGEMQNDDSVIPMANINQCHLIGTLLGFQYTPLFVLKNIIGIPITIEEMEAYTSLWRYIGFVLGCVEPKGCIPLESFASSRAWMARVWQSLINPDTQKGADSTTLMLSNHVLKAIAASLQQKQVGKTFNLNEQTIEAFFRAFLTDEYANMIKLNAIHWSYELQIRCIIAFMRMPPVILYQLHLNWLAVYFAQQLYRFATYRLNHVLEKREKYHCRFAEYCGFK